MLKKYGDVICGVVLMIIAVILFISTFSIRSLLGMTPGPEFMPRVASVLLFIVSAGIAIEGYGHSKYYIPENVTEEEAAYVKAGNRKVIYSAILIGFYVFSFNTLGFVISTIIYEFCQMIILTPKNKKKNYLIFAIVSIVSTLFFYIVFNYVLYLMLPVGLLRYLGL